MTSGMPTLTQILIAMGMALVVAIAIRVYRARSAKQAPPHVHDVLMKRAQVYASESPFLAHLCRQYRTNGHLSDRQAKTVAKAIARLEAARPDPKRSG
ncbi:MAG: hypothetical protein EPO55_06100 [Reyranella sp.]|uniref:hypothetical protein n=1 Tax=Reyranella sp. TaxID=1929291 RepID=UPI0012126685|nr:hypothetical protein [Reyranella sp.]TAJ41319.1 MAG: hypothetical protein EPO55_06100 [Reyranella sp.]